MASVLLDFSAEAMSRNISEQLQEPESVDGGGLVAEYEDDYRDWVLALYPFSGADWLLLMWTYDCATARWQQSATGMVFLSPRS